MKTAFSQHVSMTLFVIALPSLGVAGNVVNLFSFDDETLPFKSNLKLTFATPRKYPGNPVLAPGPVGTVDSVRAQFYGSILRMNGKFRLWYSAISSTEIRGNQTTSARVAYAESDDGIHWRKPELGLTEFNGNKRNNLVGMPAGLDFSRIEPLATLVLHEPSDPDPSRRFKMATYGRYYPSPSARASAVDPSNTPSTVYPFFSSDGLTWRLAVPTPKGSAFDETEAPIVVKNNFELGGLYTFDGLYYVAGQELSPDVYQPDGSIARRTMVTHWSGDFIRWSQQPSYSFQRYGYRGPRQSLQEAHEPAAIWNRGNVLLGIYGLWHGAVISSERRMDLGFLVSNDGIRFREPIADHVFIPAGRDGEWDQRGLIHGQGFENVGDDTYLYYGNWDLSGAKTGYGSGAIGLATLPRDRLAFLSTRDAGEGGFTTKPLPNVQPATLTLNVEGLSSDAQMRIELLDKAGEPIAGYSGASAAVVEKDGLKTKVTWRGADLIQCVQSTYRLRLMFAGAQANQIKWYAAYLEYVK